MEKDDQLDNEKIEIPKIEYEGTVDIGFGEILKKYREDAGFTISQLSESTRILPGFIEALEKEEFGTLPGIVFGRGFVKSMCKALGVDSTNLLDLYSKATTRYQDNKSGLKLPAKEALASVRLQSERTNTAMDQLVKFLSLKSLLRQITPIGLVGAVGIIFVALLVLFVGYKSIKHVQRLAGVAKKQEIVVDPEKKKAEEPRVKEADAEEVSGVVEDTTSSEDQTSDQQLAQSTDEDSQPEENKSVAAPNNAKKAVEAASLQAAGSGEQLLEIQVIKPVKVRMSVDNGKWETSDLPVNTHQFRFKDSLQLLVLDAAAVKISFNGKPLGSLGKEGRVRRLTFMAKRDDSKKTKKM